MHTLIILALFFMFEANTFCLEFDIENVSKDDFINVLSFTDGRVHDFGQKNDNENFDITIKKNTSDKNYEKLRLFFPCSCITIKEKLTQLKAGEEKQFSVNVNLNRYAGVFSQKISIYAFGSLDKKSEEEHELLGEYELKGFVVPTNKSYRSQQFQMAGDSIARQELQACADKKSKNTHTFSIEVPGIYEISKKIESYAKKIPRIAKFKFEVSAKASYELSETCCDDESSDDPVDKKTYSGSAKVNAELEIPAVGDIAEFTFNPKSKVHCLVYGAIKAGVFITPSADGEIGVSGEESECEKCISTILEGSIGLAFYGEFKLEGVAEVFEKGHWYSIDGSVEAQAKVGVSTSIKFGGSYRLGSNCQSTGATGKFEVDPATFNMIFKCKAGAYVNQKYRQLLSFSYEYSRPIW